MENSDWSRDFWESFRFGKLARIEVSELKSMESSLLVSWSSETGRGWVLAATAEATAGGRSIG